jgi:hypothetical protein
MPGHDDNSIAAYPLAAACAAPSRAVVTAADRLLKNQRNEESEVASKAMRGRSGLGYMTRETFAQKLAVRILAHEGMTAIWRLHVAAADAYERAQFSVAATLIEIADAAEREWLLCRAGVKARAV